MMSRIVEFVRVTRAACRDCSSSSPEIVEDSRNKLPRDRRLHPAMRRRLKAAAIAWLPNTRRELRLVGGDIGRVLVHLLIGMVMARWSRSTRRRRRRHGPFATALAERARRWATPSATSCRAVRISALNTSHGDLPARRPDSRSEPSYAKSWSRSPHRRPPARVGNLISN